MTVKKTDDDMKEPKADTGPELLGEDLDLETVKALKARYPKARQIERLASGNYAIRLRSKTVYKRGNYALRVR